MMRPGIYTCDRCAVQFFGTEPGRCTGCRLHEVHVAPTVCGDVVRMTLPPQPWGKCRHGVDLSATCVWCERSAVAWLEGAGRRYDAHTARRAAFQRADTIAGRCIALGGLAGWLVALLWWLL